MTRIRHITKAEASRYLQKKCSFLLLQNQGPLNSCWALTHIFSWTPGARAARLSGRLTSQAGFRCCGQSWLAKGWFADKAYPHMSMEPTRRLSAACAAGFSAS